mgnify:FL=1
MIADEVMSGFGRTGRWFAVDHWGVVPDMITVAKGLTSAYAPLGAVAMTEEIAGFFSERVYQSGLTYNAHPISLAAAAANIEVMQTDNLVERAARNGAYQRRRLVDLVKHTLRLAMVVRSGFSPPWSWYATAARGNRWRLTMAVALRWLLFVSLSSIKGFSFTPIGILC